MEVNVAADRDHVHHTLHRAENDVAQAAAAVTTREVQNGNHVAVQVRPVQKITKVSQNQATRSWAHVLDRALAVRTHNYQRKRIRTIKKRTRNSVHFAVISSVMPNDCNNEPHDLPRRKPLRRTCLWSVTRRRSICQFKVDCMLTIMRTTISI